MPAPAPSPAFDKFRRAYSASTSVSGIFILIYLVASVFSGFWRLFDSVIALAFAVIPLIPVMRKGGIRKKLMTAAWIARGHAVILLIVQISMFVGFTKTHGEGPNGEGSPLAYIIGMVFFAVLFLCPWLLTALRSFGFQRIASPDVAGDGPEGTHSPQIR